MATFRLVVVAGRAYVEKYHPAFQTRDVFTLWGILQLLARYPGRVPDLDLMFFCGDIPAVRAAAYPDRSEAPPLFMYCTEDAALDIAFPDWTFWGWPEVNIRPWAPFLEEVAARPSARRGSTGSPTSSGRATPTSAGCAATSCAATKAPTAAGTGTRGSSIRTGDLPTEMASKTPIWRNNARTGIQKLSACSPNY